MPASRFSFFSWPTLLCALAACLPSAAVAAGAPEAANVDKSAASLMAVLRESPGKNKQDDLLQPVGKGRAQMADGKIVNVDFAWYEYIGDMHVRFVFDSPKFVVNAEPDDLRRLNLTPQAALTVAIENLKRVYGRPRAQPFSDDVMEVRGNSADYNSSYFLDLPFWQTLARQSPEGVVAAPAKRGGLLYVPVANAASVEGLRKGVGALYESGGRMRLSSGLYLFKDGHWTVYQAPLPVRPRAEVDIWRNKQIFP